MPAEAVPHFFGEPGAGTRVDLAGAEHTITLTAEQTGGVLSLDVISMPPKWAGQPAHVHQCHEETFFVLAGRVAYQLGERRIAGAAGSTLYVPRGVRHAFANPYEEPARLLNVFTPAGYENFYGELAALLTGAYGRPGLPDVQNLFAKYGTVMRAHLPPDPPARAALPKRRRPAAP
jgi:quercetin dioxygenase-like cupin family protein